MGAKPPLLLTTSDTLLIRHDVIMKTIWQINSVREGRVQIHITHAHLEFESVVEATTEK